MIRRIELLKKQIFYSLKFKSSRLKEYDYNIENLTCKKARRNKELISMFDSQLLRSVRDIKGIEINYDTIQSLQNEKERLKKAKSSNKETLKQIENIQRQIDDILFIPEIISIVMESKGDYDYLYKNKLKLNNKEFRRLSCAAGQARASTVIFCDTEIADQLDEILDNGRDKTKPLVPSKFNAYKGLVTSSTSVVPTPRFCLVPDYESTADVKVNFVTETGLNEDDIIEEKTIPEIFNRFDGQGLISVEMATKWAEELGLDYIPAQWCVRQNYIKGMLSTFDIHRFCEEKNNGNYIIETSYSDENGNRKMVDLRNIDVIISESQFKLWSSFPSIEVYQENCKKNNLKWGVTLVSPKKDKDILMMNYQFLQTLSLSKKDIEKLCEKFVNWISGVTSKDIYYTILFLMGTEIDENKVLNYLNRSENHWIKALILNNDLIHDKWFKKKIYDLIKKKIKSGCLGSIPVDGNFQVLVSDPFAQMQHVCGLEVTGLLGKKEYYSNYWNKKDVKTVDSMRAPLTYRSEHVLLNLKDTEEVDEWYKYNDSGIIVNVHGHETINWAGSDFDFDIIATTSNPTIIKGVYRDELPIAYTPPKSKPKLIKDRDLFIADKHSFGSEIGQITNKSTSGFALLADLEEGTKEYETTLQRIRMCTKLQSAQIDKAKIGRKVKSIPKIWLQYNKINDDDSEKVKENKQFLNSILLDKHPYFFTYLYKGTRRKYKEYYKNQNITCQQLFGKNIEELKDMRRKTTEQIDFLKNFYKYSPVIDSDCVMNNLCRYIESIDFGIRNIVKQEDNSEYYKSMMSGQLTDFDDTLYKKIVRVYNDFKDLSSSLASTTSNQISVRNTHDDEIEGNINIVYESLEQSLIKICPNVYQLVDYLIYMFYEDKKTSNKEVLWNVFGKYIIENMRNKVDKIILPIPCESGEYDYLNVKYTLKEVNLNE